jgi:two-component system response regulator YesN
LLEHDIKLRQILQYIQQNLADPDLSVTRLADKVDLSVSQVTRLMRGKLGLGTLDYIQKTRIDCAKKLLAETGLNLSEISRRVGYYNFRTMNNIFKKIEGITGTQYREREQKTKSS